MIVEIRIKKNKKKNSFSFAENPARVIVTSFAMLIIIGTVLLMMPFCSASGSFTPFMTALFTATSATCVTGLVLVDTATYYSIIGQSVILFLIQVGGLGLVTFTTFFNLMLRRKMKFRNMQVAQESISASSFSDMVHLIRTIFLFSLIFELLGALLLCIVFVPEYGNHGIFISAFLSVSAYCNGGFDILGFLEPFGSVTHFYNSPIVLGTLMALIICGSMGFIVWRDLFGYHRTHRLALHTKVVLWITAALCIGGTLLIAIGEWNNPATIGSMTFGQKLLNSAFLSVSTRTAGFNSFSITDMNDISKMFSIILMFIGAAPGSTGGGIKLTTAVVLVMTVICALRDLPDTIIWKHKIDKNTVYKALAVTSVGLLAVSITVIVICCTPQHGEVALIDALFEAVSGFATVGISDGVVAISNLPTQILFVFVMFLGRVGPVSLGLSMTLRHARARELASYELLPEGKLLVG